MASNAAMFHADKAYAHDQARSTKEVIERGSSSDQLAYRWAVANQGYEGDFAAWCEMPMQERLSYEERASHGDSTRDIVARGGMLAI